MNIKAIAFCALIALAGCDRPEPAAPTPVAAAPKPANISAQAAAAKTAELKDSMEKAMGDIPPNLRNVFQEAFSCVVTRNNVTAKNNGTQPPEIGPKDIREITAKLKANPSAAPFCTSAS